MKIQGPNPYINLYKKQHHNQKAKTLDYHKDKLNISNEAKKLQKNENNLDRIQYVDEMKQLVQSGQYKVDYEKTAGKMIDFLKRV